MFQRYFLAPLAALLLLAAAPRLAYAQTGGVGIGTTAPDASALLDLTSTSKGLLPPRLSQAQRDAIASPATGLTIYNTTTNKLNTWNGTSWDASLSATEQPFMSGSKTTFSYTGGTQTYTVPTGVTSLLVDLAGAQGGRNNGANAGGTGARVQATLAVTPGEVLTLYVGGAGSTAPSAPGGAGYNGGGNGGYNGGNRGGGGGGASDVRRSATAPSTALADRLLVAAGGGGGGGGGSPGGAGGALNGSAGGASAGITAGTGATQSAGGNANGALGQGGDTPAKNPGGGGNSGGGGGGGYYGGGGALSNGGGGGGSSYVQASGSSAVTMTGGYQAGNGYVTLTLPPAYAAPALSGTNFINVPGTWSVNGTSYYYNNGNVGIGTSTPSQKLDVAGNANVSGSTSIGGNANVGGNLGVGTSTPSQKLDVAGNANVSGTTSVGGDASVGGNGFIAGQTGIGSSSADASAQLQVTSTTRGFLPPRLSQTQRDAIASPATGLTVYNTTTNKLDVWNDTAWTEALTTTEQPITYPAQSFAFTGTTQPYVVPPGVTRLQVDAAGGKGGYNNSVGGLGGRVQTILTVVPGETLYVTVGGQGTVTYSSTPGTGGYNGGGTPGSGGGGGGATDIRRGGTALSNRILVASGGGGGGGGSTGFANGGNGGYPSGTPSPTSSTSGQGGTQTAGGAAGSGDNTASAGSLGQGGNGTGGGGGGYYGGGGGGGAGGGSSYVTAAGSSGTTYSSGTYSSTANYNGSLTLTPRPAYAAPALDATNFVNVPGDNLGNHTATQNLNLSTYLLVGNGGTQGLAISSSGNVSIGTATATQALDVNGGILARANGAISNQGSYLQWNRSGGDGETWLLNQQGGGGGGICFGSATTANATTEWARFDGSGNVGIGTPTPSQKLDVAGNANVSGNSTVGGQLTAASATLGSTTVSGTTTLTGATAINTTGTASTSIGNGTGAVILPGLSTAGFVTNSASGQLGTTTAASLGSSFVLNQSTQQTGATFNVSGAGTVGGALTAGSASITSSATVGGSLGVGISSPAGQLANTASNVIATDGNGISTQGLGWVNTTAVGYAGVFYNARSAANGDGLAVKVASASAVALDVSQGSSATTAGAPLLRVQGSGQVGIGTSAPAGGLHVTTGNGGAGTGASTAGVVMSGSSGQPPYLELRGSGTGTSTSTPYIDFAETNDQDYATRLISMGGTLNINGSTQLLLKVNGSMQATNVVYTSDARFKQHVRPLSSALSSVLALRGVRYEWNALGVAHGGTAGAPQVGLLAQEVEKVYPELVSTDAQGYKAVNYAQLTPVLLEAIKEQQQQLEALKATAQAANTRAAAAEAHATQASTEAAAANAQATATLAAFEARLRRLEAGTAQAQR